jgi:hypothetical protein
MASCLPPSIGTPPRSGVLHVASSLRTREDPSDCIVEWAPFSGQPALAKALGLRPVVSLRLNCLVRLRAQHSLRERKDAVCRPVRGKRFGLDVALQNVFEVRCFASVSEEQMAKGSFAFRRPSVRAPSSVIRNASVGAHVLTPLQKRPGSFQRLGLTSNSASFLQNTWRSFAVTRKGYGLIRKGAFTTVFSGR